MAGIISPYCIVKTTEKLKYSSYLTLIAISLVVLCTFYTFFSKLKNDKLPDFNWYPTEYYSFDVIRAIGVLPAVFTAFNFHYNVFPIYRSLEKPSDAKYQRIIFIS